MWSAGQDNSRGTEEGLSQAGLDFIWEESRNVSLRNYVWAVKKGERIAGKRGLVGRNQSRPMRLRGEWQDETLER